jgi:alpha-L-rhamnosidase
VLWPPGQLKHLAVELECPSTGTAARRELAGARALRPLPMPAASADPSAPDTVQVELVSSPVGLDARQLYVTWAFGGMAGLRAPPGALMDAAQVTILDAQTSAEVWTSGWTAVTRPALAIDTGDALVSDHVYLVVVSVKAGSSAGRNSSATAFSTGLLAQSDWQAQWIKGGNIFRKPVSVGPGVARASAFISACQYYELYVDGQRVGANVLDVGWTNFDTNRSYTAYALDPAIFSHGCHEIGGPRERERERERENKKINK